MTATAHGHSADEWATHDAWLTHWTGDAIQGRTDMSNPPASIGLNLSPVSRLGNDADPDAARPTAIGLVPMTLSDDYWARWSPQARSLYDRFDLVHDRPGHWLTLSPESPAPDWLRAATAGALQPPESPSLCIARVWDPIDWPALLKQHFPDVVPFSLTTEVGWEDIVAVWRLLESRGLRPAIDASLEIEDLDAGPWLVLTPSGIGTTDTVADPQTIRDVQTLLRGDFLQNWSDTSTCWDWLAA